MTLLRRNIHRLEKGLLMRPMRIPFGLDYISETVEAYDIAMRSGIDDLETSWAHNVLEEYFRQHAGQAALERGHRRFLEIPQPAASPDKRIPYHRAPPPSTIGYADFMALARHRRSVRWYLPTPVPRECIDRAIEVAAQAPTACNRLPYQFRVFDEPGIVQSILGIPFGTAGFSHNVPVVIVVVGRQRHFFSERDRHLIYVDSGLATMGLLYALEVQGISTCCINWPDLEAKEAEMSTLLKLEADERPVMLVAVGHADPSGLVANSPKKSLDQLRRFNFE